MASVINKLTAAFLESVHTPDYDPSDWLINPDLTAVSGVPKKYWKVVADAVVEMNQTEKDAVDAALEPVIERVNVKAETETQTGSSSYVAKAVLSPTNLNNTSRHKISWYCEVNNTSTSGRTQVKVDYDGTIVAEPSIESEDSNDWVPFSGFALLDAGVVPSTITLSFARATSGTAKVRRARLEIKRT